MRLLNAELHWSNNSKCERLLRPPRTPAIKHHCSIYADDITIFMHLDVAEARAIMEILRLFGDASGLTTNLATCSIASIHTPDDNLLQL